MTGEWRIAGGLVERAEIASVMYLAESLVKINYGHIITCILNTREQDVEVPKPVVKVVNIRDRDVGETAVIGLTEQENCRVDPGQSRRERGLARLRTDHLNSEEKNHSMCFFYYQDVFSCRGTNYAAQTRPSILLSSSRGLPP